LKIYSVIACTSSEAILVGERLERVPGTRSEVIFAIPCLFARMIAQAVLQQDFVFGGKERRVMAHPKGFR
jgi:hypothetical protein